LVIQEIQLGGKHLIMLPRSQEVNTL
jgi:hypothetical protein